MRWSKKRRNQSGSCRRGLPSGAHQLKHPMQLGIAKESTIGEEISDEERMDEDKIDPNCPIIPVTREEKERLRRPSLIIRVLGRKVSYSYLLQRLEKMWKPEASFELIALDQDYFLAKFDSARDYDFAKYEGPWIILGHYLTVQEWEPNFFPHKHKMDRLLVWVRFPSVPIEYFDENRRPVKMDTTTSLASIGKFARICVEVDLSKPLLSKFTLAGEVLPIEYESIQLVCFKCGIYGHKQGQSGDHGSEPKGNVEINNQDRVQNNEYQIRSDFVEAQQNNGLAQ